MQALLLSVVAGAAVAQPNRELCGQVFHLGENAEKVPDKGLMVTCQETGSSDDTNDQGLFRLPLPPAWQPGNKVTLIIDKPGWRIRYPLDGEAIIPASLSKEIVSVELLPAGSKLFWTNDRIEKFIEDSIARVKPESPKDKGGKVDLNRYLKDWATGLGFTPQDVQKEIERWSTEVEKNHEDGYTRGLAAFAKEQFADAARHFQDSADWDVRQLEEAQRREEDMAKAANKWREKLVRDLRLAGNSHYQGGDYQKALASYQEAHKHTSREATPESWAATLNDTGLALANPGAESAAPFEEAARAYRQALLVYTREKFPKDWAGTELNLGSALWIQGRRTDGERGAQLLAEAVEASRQALLVYTREKFPEDWAAIQINLSGALSDQGRQTEGERGAQLLAEAVEACRQARLVWTREQNPQRWAMIQNNLGIALSGLGARTKGERGAQLLRESVEAYRQALLVHTREKFPREWAKAQSNLGSALWTEGARTEGERGAQLLAESLEAYRQALFVSNREQFSKEWVEIQQSLAGVLKEQGKRTKGEQGAQLLAEAVEANRQVLLVYTRERFPQHWAMTQNDLGISLYEQGRRTSGEPGVQLLAKSVEAFRLAVLVHTREQFHRDWAMFQNNLGYSLREQGWRTQGERGVQLLAEAAETNRQALLVYTRERFPQDWARTQSELGLSLGEQGERTEGEGGIQLLTEAVQAFRSAREIFTYEQFPREWMSARKYEVEAFLLSTHYEDAAKGLSDILSKNPDYGWAVNSWADLLDNRLFDYHQALSVSQKWLTRNPGDLEARCLEIEALFATGDFGDCQAKSASLQKATGLEPGQQTALLGYEVAAGMVLGSPDSCVVLEKLIDQVKIQPPDFRSNWIFSGTLHALQEHSDLPHRDWLVRLFKILESQDRDSILRGLQALQAEAKPFSARETGRPPTPAPAPHPRP